ncbi:MAG TPA: N-acetylmuramoyl-L-alanine amidase [Anaerolineae bacterium]|nr:N-acetylmuramoyl-L-alanine amidase [Anaerolineae bacterium]
MAISAQQRLASRQKANRSQVMILVAVGFVGAALLFVITGAAANRSTAREVIIESSQASLTPGAALAIPGAGPTPRSTVARPAGPYVGIVAGHWGNDSGAVCPDGVTEQQVNLEIAKLVAAKLRARGVWVDLLQEFDSRLNGFSADVLVSIHADSCDPIDADPPATGFKVARSQASQIPTITDKLVECLRTEYQKSTRLVFHENSITNDMTFYHSFNELDPNTPAVIIETGFLHLDYDMIVKQPELSAEGITNGILCFLKTQL